MTRKIDLVVLNPAGNTTILVLSPTDRSDYAEVANKLLEMDFGEQCPWADSVKGEQVAYALEDPAISADTEDPAKADALSGSSDGSAVPAPLPAMEMCGLEFCGNASRAFAYYRVAACGDGEAACGDGEAVDGKKELQVQVSGCRHPLKAAVDVAGAQSRIEMPLPVEIKTVDTAPAGVNGEYPLIDLDGITHMVMAGVEPSAERFDRIKKFIYEEVSPEMEAFGVMFINEETGLMSPVVYVRDVDTTYFEGSCASGTTAASVAKAIGEVDGTYRYSFRQPAGTLSTEVTKAGGKITGITLGGLMEMSGVIHVEI